VEKILIQAILRLAKVQKFDFLSVTPHRVVNELDELFLAESIHEDEKSDSLSPVR